MNNPIIPALRLLGHFWLEEIKPADAETIAALPELAATLPDVSIAALDALAVEYQRLFGFNLPPYESVFIDPSAMLQAPATERVQALYRRAGWSPPAGTRSGAPDHLGLELLALADWTAEDQLALAQQLHLHHLALWAPPFIFALQRLTPHPFYATLADLTLTLLLTTLPEQPNVSTDTLFPDLPPPPVYRGSDDPFDSVAALGEADQTEEAPQSAMGPGLRQIIKRFLPPREAGLFISREDLAQISLALDLPVAVGERYRMLETLFRQAGQYDLLPLLFDQLTQLLTEANRNYWQLVETYPAWLPYAQAWRQRIAGTQAALEELQAALAENKYPLE